MPQRLKVTPEAMQALLERLYAHSIIVDDYELVIAIVEAHVLVDSTLSEKQETVMKLLRMLFGAKTEKKKTVLHESVVQPDVPKEKPKGHGRNGRCAYTGSKNVTVAHPVLKSGDLCPACRKGHVYPGRPSVLVRITGGAPLAATSWELEKLRCNLCGEVFTPPLPQHAGTTKYDATAGAMLALLRYGSGLPFNRLKELQESMGVPLPASTQWDIVEKTADRIHPVYRELIRQAAQGSLIHNDDTTMKILAAVCEEGRSGTFTTGMLSRGDDHTIALFFTGGKHAGENLTEVLRHRQTGLDPPMQMADALSRNTSGEFTTLLANCLAHARRNFVDVAQSFPEECRHVIDVLGEVYNHDAWTTKQTMSPEERLLYHQAESGPLMEGLQRWMSSRFGEKKVEPNSGLGKAFSYMLKHWEPLTLFLRVPGAPLDNNVCERALKMAIRHRRNSLFYRTLHGAYIGDLFMSIIHTCRLAKVNPFDYLVALQKHSSDVFRSPQRWLPWNYETASG